MAQGKGCKVLCADGRHSRDVGGGRTVFVAPFAERLQTLAGTFEKQQLIELIKQYLEV